MRKPRVGSRDNTSYALYTMKTKRWTTLSGLRISRAFYQFAIPKKKQAHYSNHISRILKEFNDFFKKKQQIGRQSGVQQAWRGKFDNALDFNYN